MKEKDIENIKNLVENLSNDFTDYIVKFQTTINRFSIIEKKFKELYKFNHLVSKSYLNSFKTNLISEIRKFPEIITSNALLINIPSKENIGKVLKVTAEEKIIKNCSVLSLKEEDILIINSETVEDALEVIQNELSTETREKLVILSLVDSDLVALESKVQSLLRDNELSDVIILPYNGVLPFLKGLLNKV